MSRIGRKAIEIPNGVTREIKPALIPAQGPKPTLTLPRHKDINVKQEGNELIFERTREDKSVKAAHGLMRALTANLLTGVTQGFTRQLEINGVGYRAEVKGQNVVLTLGYSHPIEYK